MKKSASIALFLVPAFILGCVMQPSKPPVVEDKVSEETVGQEKTAEETVAADTIQPGIPLMNAEELIDAEDHEGSASAADDDLYVAPLAAEAPVVPPAAAEQSATPSLRMDTNYVFVRRVIPFASSAHALGPVARRAFAEMLPLAQEARAVEVKGRSDASGTKEMNKELALKRAREVRRLFIAGGVDAKKIRTSYCTTCFVQDNATDAGRRANRRVDVDLELHESKARELPQDDYKPVLALTREIGEEHVVGFKSAVLDRADKS